MENRIRNLDNEPPINDSAPYQPQTAKTEGHKGAGPWHHSPPALWSKVFWHGADDKVTLLVGPWLASFPVAQASSSIESNDSAVTVVLLVLLLLVLCAALILAWKRLIDTDGGEGYHPHVLWGRARGFMRSAKTRWIPEKREEEDSAAEDEAEEEEEDEDPEPNEETDITAL